MDDTLSAGPPSLGTPPLQPPLPLRLPAELTIYTVGELHPQWLSWLAAAEPDAAVLCRDVEQVDAAGLQLLLSLQRALNDRGHSLALQAPSTALRSACDGLGLGPWLEQHCAEATA